MKKRTIKPGQAAFWIDSGRKDEPSFQEIFEQAAVVSDQGQAVEVRVCARCEEVDCDCADDAAHYWEV